jgi:hypothetical protein
MKRKNYILPLVIIFVFFTAFEVVDAASIQLTATYDDGHGFSGWGGSWDDVPSTGECKIYMYAQGLQSEVFCWLGSQIYFSSAKSVSMTASLDLTGYVACTVFIGSGILKAYLECRRTDADRTLVWSVKVWDDIWGPGETHTYSDLPLTLDTTDFPKAVSAGTYYFCARISFIGACGGLFQYSSGDTSKGIMEVNSITVSW